MPSFRFYCRRGISLYEYALDFGGVHYLNRYVRHRSKL